MPRSSRSRVADVVGELAEQRLVEPVGGAQLLRSPRASSRGSRASCAVGSPITRNRKKLKTRTKIERHERAERPCPPSQRPLNRLTPTTSSGSPSRRRRRRRATSDAGAEPDRDARSRASPFDAASGSRCCRPPAARASESQDASSVDLLADTGRRCGSGQAGSIAADAVGPVGLQVRVLGEHQVGQVALADLDHLLDRSPCAWPMSNSPACSSKSRSYSGFE